MVTNAAHLSPEPGSALADPVGDARRRLFSPLANRTLAEAADALKQGQPGIAEPLITKYLDRRPRDPDALNLMADIARRRGDLAAAAELLSECVSHPGYRFNYAVVLRRLGKFEEALAQVDELLKRDPRSPVFRDQRAKVLDAMGLSAEAIQCRRELTENYPGAASLWLAYGEVLRGPGPRDACIAAWRKAIECDSSLTQAYLRLSDLKTYRFEATEISAMEALLRNPALGADERANLHFALGRAHGQQEAHAKAFEHYAKGNALRRMSVSADPERLTQHRRNCEALFTESFYDRRQGWGCQASEPIFVVGLPRSGSTLVEQILASHSAIQGRGELSCMDSLVLGRLRQDQQLAEPGKDLDADPDSLLETGLPNGLQIYRKVFEALTADEYRAMGENYLALTRNTRRANGRVASHKEQATFFTDKALSNFGHIGLISLMLPNAKIVEVRRHPLDCGWSCFTNHFPQGMRFSYRLQDIGRHYYDYVRLMAHFDQVLPGKVHRVVYEELVEHPEREIGRMLAFIGVPFEAQCLRFHENRRPVDTLSSEQVRQPLYKEGVAQWQPYEPWLSPLKAALGSVLDFYPAVPPA